MDVSGRLEGAPAEAMTSHDPLTMSNFDDQEFEQYMSQSSLRSASTNMPPPPPPYGPGMTSANGSAWPGSTSCRMTSSGASASGVLQRIASGQPMGGSQQQNAGESPINLSPNSTGALATSSATSASPEISNSARDSGSSSATNATSASHGHHQSSPSYASASHAATLNNSPSSGSAPEQTTTDADGNASASKLDLAAMATQQQLMTSSQAYSYHQHRESARYNFELQQMAARYGYHSNATSGSHHDVTADPAAVAAMDYTSSVHAAQQYSSYGGAIAGTNPYQCMGIRTMYGMPNPLYHQ